VKFRRPTSQEKREAKEKRLSAWHKIFAFWPRRLTHDQHEVCWLQYVYRRGTFKPSRDGPYWVWEYAESEFDILRIDDKK